MNYSIDWDGPGERDDDEGLSDLDLAFRAGALWRHMQGRMDGLEAAAASWAFIQSTEPTPPDA